MCGQQRNSPMADPIFGSKYGPQNGVQNWITFSFLLLGLCLGPVLGSRFGPKSGVSHRRILLLPAEVLQADLRRTSMSVSVNTCFFSLCVPLCFLYSRGPFLAAMFLLVFCLGVSDSIEISWLRYHVKTRARRGSSFSQLGLEPNHTGWTAQSLFFLEESCRVKRSDTQTFSNFSKYFQRVLKL